MSQGDSQILVFVGVPKPHSSSLSFNRQTWTHLVGMGVFAYFHLFSQHLPIVFPHCCSWLVLSTSQHSLYGGLFFFCNRTLQNILPTQTLFSRFLKIFPEFCSRMFHSFSQSCPDHVPIISNRFSHGFSRIPTCFLAYFSKFPPIMFP